MLPFVLYRAGIFALGLEFLEAEGVPAEDTLSPQRPGASVCHPALGRAPQPGGTWDFCLIFTAAIPGRSMRGLPTRGRMRASCHTRSGLSFREQGVLFDSQGRKPRPVAAGGWQSRRAEGWLSLLEPRAPHSPQAPGILRGNVRGLGGHSAPPASSRPIRSGESGKLAFLSAKMALPYLLNKSRGYCSSLTGTFGLNQTFK